MSVIRVKKSKPPYVTLNTTALNDPRLSFRAKGLHTYLMSKPDNWKVYIAQLEKESPKEGREAIASALKELEEAGYIKRERLRGEKGRMAGWDTTIYETADLAEQEASATENGLADIGSTEIGLSEVGSTEFGLPAASNTGFKQVLKEVKPDSSSPPLSPQGDSCTGKIAKARTDADAVLAHLNALSGRKYTAVQHIAARLHQGATLQQCLMVLDWWVAVKVPQSPDQAQYFDNVTPFRPANFDKYRAAAEAWNQQGRPSWRASPHANGVVSEKGLRTAYNAQDVIQEIQDAARRQPTLLRGSDYDE